MSGDSDARIVIAGAGIAGLAAALAFHKAGREVVVVERAPSLQAVGAGILIQANGLLVLDALGLGEQVRAAGASRRTFDLRDRRGSLLLRTDFDRALPPGLWPTCLHRADLHRILWEACATAGVSLRLGCTVKGVEPHATTPALVYATATGEELIGGDLVIGADGVKSVVRDVGGFATRVEPAIEGSVQGVSPVSASDELHGEYLGAGEACGLLPIGGGRTFWFWGGDGKFVREIEGTPFAAWKTRVCERFPAMRHALAHQQEWPGAIRLLHRSVHCERWSRGRIALIGDAAHAMSPNLGQGANCALVDALALACHVAAQPARADLSDALAQYERARRPMVETIQRRGRQEAMTGALSWPGVELLLKLALPLTRFASDARRLADVRAMSGLASKGLDLAAAGVHLPPPWRARHP